MLRQRRWHDSPDTLGRVRTGSGLRRVPQSLCRRTRRSGSTSTISVVHFISKTMSFALWTHVVPTWTSELAPGHPVLPVCRVRDLALQSMSRSPLGQVLTLGKLMSHTAPVASMRQARYVPFHIGDGGRIRTWSRSFIVLALEAGSVSPTPRRTWDWTWGDSRLSPWRSSWAALLVARCDRDGSARYGTGGACRGPIPCRVASVWRAALRCLPASPARSAPAAPGEVMMGRRVRALLAVVATGQALLAVLFVLQVPWATAIWPFAGTGETSYIFVAEHLPRGCGGGRLVSPDGFGSGPGRHRPGLRRHHRAARRPLPRRSTGPG